MPEQFAVRGSGLRTYRLVVAPIAAALCGLVLLVVAAVEADAGRPFAPILVVALLILAVVAVGSLVLLARRRNRER